MVVLYSKSEIEKIKEASLVVKEVFKQLKSYIKFCLALSQMAKTLKTASPKPQQNEIPKYAMRTWLLRLGFIGEEFKTAREVLTKRLAGDTAVRNGRVA